VVHIEAVLFVNGCVVFDDVGDFAAVSVDIMRSPIPNITKPLNRKSLIAYAPHTIPNFLNERLRLQQLTNCVVNAHACGFRSAGNATVLDMLSSAAPLEIDIRFAFYFLVLILDPSHDLLTSSQIWSEAIHAGADVALFYQFHCVGTGDALQFTLGKFSGVDSDAAFGSTEWHIRNRQLKSHKTSQGFNFLQINILCVPGSTLDRQLVS